MVPPITFRVSLFDFVAYALRFNDPGDFIRKLKPAPSAIIVAGTLDDLDKPPYRGLIARREAAGIGPPISRAEILLLATRIVTESGVPVRFVEGRA